MNTFFDTVPKNELYLFLISIIAILFSYWLISYFLRKFGKDPKYLLPEGTFRKLSWPIFFIFISILVRSGSLRTLLNLTEHEYFFKKTSTILFIFSLTWLLLNLLKIIKKIVISNYDVHVENNLKARKIYTQFNILERILIFTIVILAMGAALMSFESIRELGVSIFASAGVAGIIIGFSAQKMIGTVLAGIQIAIAQPIKIDDVVIVEGEWGRIEEITLTYVVVKIWDKRRLIVPTPYFIEKPFQNWTKTSSDILGTVFLYTDYNVSFDALREELTKILESTDLWDKEVNILQVTESKQDSVEIRALMSAKDSPTAWDLRVLVREKLITFLQQNYPESIARNRVLLEKSTDENNNS
ncbi:MAG: mechanosensitive ion channel domain-containing protein [Maribacter sp.]